MTQALYRRYRPETFEEVIGQDHVTGPLQAALTSGRVSHAYLFSGPRGCGKTTSARILARCLNCEAGPVATPCGQCQSCRELGRGGGGSLDVVEIDAASHNGVDDARDLRERAVYAPARDRYKVFILDEAHMVTPQGFNALLKLVEEPPAHVKFVFATTEPEKVIGTIRSRTHHYPFHLVPPSIMASYMEDLCRAESIQAEPGVLSLVVKSGGGSVRDSESVLDQLIAGSHDAVLTYSGAVALLGFTPENLLEAMVDAIDRADGGAALRAVDAVIEAGGDPRRFVEDLLERLRDLIVLAAAGDAALASLRSVPPDALGTMQAQASRMGLAVLSRAADVVNDGLTRMMGATSPRLQVELLVPRILVEVRRLSAQPPSAPPVRPDPPAGSGGGAGRPARSGQGGHVGQGGPVGHGAPGEVGARGVRPDPPADSGGAADGAGQGVPAAPAGAAPGGGSDGVGARTGRGPDRPDSSAQVGPAQWAPDPDPGAGSGPAAPAPEAAASGASAGDAAGAWAKVLGRLRGPIASIMRNNATLDHIDGQTFVFVFNGTGPLEFFRRQHSQERLAEAAADVLGSTFEFTGHVDGDSPAPTQPARPPATTASAPPAAAQTPTPPAAAQAPAPASTPAPAPAAQPAAAPGPAANEGKPPAAPPQAPSSSEPAERPVAEAPVKVASPQVTEPQDEPGADMPAPDDQDAEAAGLIGLDLVLRELGGEVIEDQP